MLTFASEYPVKFLNFYPHLCLETVFTALKLKQICCMNIYEHLCSWKLAIESQIGSSSPTHIKIVLTTRQNMKVSRTFMNWNKLWRTTRATLTNPSFQYFSELGKSLKYMRGPTLKNPNFESKNELKNEVPIWIKFA